MGTALLVVDVQVDVVAEHPGAERVLPALAGLVDAARAAGRPVVWVQHDDEELVGAALRERGVDHVVLAGVQSAFCVDLAGKHALAEGFDVTLVGDAHANGPLDTSTGELSDEQVRAVVNRTWSTLRHPGRTVEVVAAADVAW